MNVPDVEGWPHDVAGAVEMQRQVAEQVDIPAHTVPTPTTVAGLDISYDTGSDRIIAAAVVAELATGAIVEQVVVAGVAQFPYVPGLLAFREIPMLLQALWPLRTVPDVLICDGQGIAHPRRCGLACHLGVLTGRPALGCAKTRFIGTHDEPGPQRGDHTPLYDGADLIGTALRTQRDVKPVYVSPGHGIGIAQSCQIVLALCSTYRLPDPIRHADHISRRALAHHPVEAQGLLHHS
ncbi:endonuclease V [Pseudonocardia xinjiangensis]|uniref:endonuclease V n=1 Tax=Pseudonocardia xinjiangensis TaxID=75289 RepID=UPI003D8EE2EE